jgi:hypothetical protein
MAMKKVLTFALCLLASYSATFSQSLPSPAIKPLNINFKNRSYFYASGPKLEKTAGLGGWADSGNMFIPIGTETDFTAGKLSIHVNTNDKTVFAEKYTGLILYVSNGSADTVYFDAQDSRLNMKLQALDKNGRWQDIEYLPSSWCGNSYHMVYLPPQYYWKFTIPEYEGKMRTRLRAVLQFKKALDGSELSLYSNEFEGSINPGQFSRMPEYQPNGIMDPYDN